MPRIKRCLRARRKVERDGEPNEIRRDASRPRSVLQAKTARRKTQTETAGEMQDLGGWGETPKERINATDHPPRL
jgi:hypothetical protein